MLYKFSASNTGVNLPGMILTLIYVYILYLLYENHAITLEKGLTT
jgi:hypothetical protein